MIPDDHIEARAADEVAMAAHFPNFGQFGRERRLSLTGLPGRCFPAGRLYPIARGTSVDW